MSLGPGSFDSFGIPQSRPGTLDDLDDVDTAEVKEGQTIIHRAGRWVPGTASASEGVGSISEVEIGNVEPVDLAVELWVNPSAQPARARTSSGGSGLKVFAGDVPVGPTCVITHNLDTFDVMVDVYLNSGVRETVRCAVERTTADSVTLRFDTAVNAGDYRCVVIGR